MPVHAPRAFLLWQSAAHSGEWERVLELPSGDDDAAIAGEMLTCCESIQSRQMAVLANALSMAGHRMSGGNF